MPTVLQTSPQTTSDQAKRSTRVLLGTTSGSNHHPSPIPTDACRPKRAGRDQAGPLPEPGRGRSIRRSTLQGDMVPVSPGPALSGDWAVPQGVDRVGRRSRIRPTTTPPSSSSTMRRLTAPGRRVWSMARTAVSAGDPDAGDPMPRQLTSLCCYLPVLSVTVYL
jgi:hypothetical protein